jgi:hypothetical protein
MAADLISVSCPWPEVKFVVVKVPFEDPRVPFDDPRVVVVFLQGRHNAISAVLRCKTRLEMPCRKETSPTGKGQA